MHKLQVLIPIQVLRVLEPRLHFVTKSKVLDYIKTLFNVQIPNMTNPEPKIFHPVHYRIIKHHGNFWSFTLSSPFATLSESPIPSFEEVLATFNITVKQIVTELFKINGGNAGYYLADIKEQKYYYCGTEWDDVKAKFLELGIGRTDPMVELYSQEYAENDS